MSSLIRALVHFEMIERAVILQRDFALLLTLVRAEEMKPMPAIVPVEQAAALLRHWNWPQSAYNRPAPTSFTSAVELYAGTTAGESLPSIWLTDWLTDVPAVTISLPPSSLINELKMIHDKHAADIAAGGMGMAAPKEPRKDHHLKKRGPKGTKEEINTNITPVSTWKNNDNNNDDDQGLGLFA
jgi:hypothetical protein